MRFNPFTWSEIEADEIYNIVGQRVFLRATDIVSVFVQAEGITALAMTGREIDFTVGEPGMQFFVFTREDAQIYLYSPEKRGIKVEPTAIFTNIDRKPLESEAVTEMKREMRKQTLAMRAEHEMMRRDLDARRAAIENAQSSRADPGDPEPDPKADADPDPTPQAKEPEPGDPGASSDKPDGKSGKKGS